MSLSPLRQALLAQLKTHVKPGSVVLDAACGSGLATAELALACTSRGRVVGLDRAPSKLHVAAKNIASKISDKELLMKINLVPLDAFADDCPGAPFDAIMVGVALPSVSSVPVVNLTRQLKIGGRLVAPVVISQQQQSSYVVAFDKGADGALLASIISGPFADVPKMEKDLEFEGESEAEKNSRLGRENRKEQAQKELATWRQRFQTDNGRRPTRDDLTNDVIAKALFDEFSKLNH